jgi:hypothetical protein
LSIKADVRCTVRHLLGPNAYSFILTGVIIWLILVLLFRPGEHLGSQCRSPDDPGSPGIRVIRRPKY